jgi:hypothetical protein
MRPPGGVYLAALFRRLPKRLRQRVSSPISSMSGPAVHVQRVAGRRPSPAAPISSAVCSAAAATCARVRADLAAVDARDVQQVVDQPHHVRQLPVHGLQRARTTGAGLGLLQDLQPGAQRRQRVAQFVRQRREEFVLGAVRLLQQDLLGLLALGDVDQRAGHAIGLPGVPQRHAGRPGTSASGPASRAAGTRPGRARRAQVRAQRCAHGGRSSGMHDAARAIGPVRELLFAVAQQRLQPRRIEHRAGGHVPVPQAGAGAARRQLVARLAGAQRVVGASSTCGTLAQFVEHRVEGVDQLADLVVAGLRARRSKERRVQHLCARRAHLLDRAVTVRCSRLDSSSAPNRLASHDQDQPADVFQQPAQPGRGATAARRCRPAPVGQHRAQATWPVASPVARPAAGARHRHRPRRRRCGSWRTGAPCRRRAPRRHAAAWPQHAQVLLAPPAVAEGQRRFAGQADDVGLRHQVLLGVGHSLRRSTTSSAAAAMTSAVATVASRISIQLGADAVRPRMVHQRPSTAAPRPAGARSAQAARLRRGEAREAHPALLRPRRTAPSRRCSPLSCSVTVSTGPGTAASVSRARASRRPPASRMCTGRRFSPSRRRRTAPAGRPASRPGDDLLQFARDGVVAGHADHQRRRGARRLPAATRRSCRTCRGTRPSPRCPGAGPRLRERPHAAQAQQAAAAARPSAWRAGRRMANSVRHAGHRGPGRLQQPAPLDLRRDGRPELDVPRVQQVLHQDAQRERGRDPQPQARIDRGVAGHAGTAARRPGAP